MRYDEPHPYLLRSLTYLTEHVRTVRVQWQGGVDFSLNNHVTDNVVVYSYYMADFYTCSRSMNVYLNTALINLIEEHNR